MHIWCEWKYYVRWLDDGKGENILCMSSLICPCVSLNNCAVSLSVLVVVIGSSLGKIKLLFMQFSKGF